ncbi:MAG: hypothetical protein WA802_17125, partial [Terracidiphilus sp.]
MTEVPDIETTTAPQQEPPPSLAPTPARNLARSFFRWLVIAILLTWALAALLLVSARWIDPPTTAVHIERRLQAWIHNKPYHERYTFVPLSQ